MTKILIIISIGLIFLLLTWWAIFDIAYKDFGSFEKKIGWGFVAVIPFLGCIVYLLFGYRQGRKRS
jgi:uncharacterized membrane protein YwzB